MTSSLTSPTPSKPIGGQPPVPAAYPGREATTYLGLVAAMVVSIALAIPNAGYLAPAISMGTPLIAVGLITLFRTPRGARRALWGTFGLRRAGWRSWPAAFVLGLLAVFIVPFGLADLLGSAHFIGLSSIDVPTAAFRLAVGLATMTLIAMAEEIGWRSYLLPRMQELLPRRRAAIVVGFCHGLFHLPLILFTSTYDSVGSRWVVAPMVVLSLTSAGVFYAWLKDRSGSVWPVAIGHTFANLTFDWGFAALATTTPASLAFVAGETGVATLAVAVVLAAVLLTTAKVWKTPPPTIAAAMPDDGTRTITGAR